ncbi:MAG: hypothetical protein QOI21_2036 [Actinomycetota bacterium]|nr:hypothetical protein [Actinomycetota bacterium]
MTSTFDPNAKPDMTPAVVITDSNKFSGSGFLDSYTFLIKSCTDIQTADDKDKAALGVAIGLGAFAAGVDTVKMVINPLGSLISAGLGWLIEHVSFLREPLDMLMGDPDQIQLLGQEVHAIAEAIRQVGQEQLESLKGDISAWTGAAADAFTKLMQELAADFESKAHATEIVGYLIHTNMAIISAARALFRDLIATVLGDIISTMLIALATAAFTFGASIVAAVPIIVTQAGLTAASMASKSAAIVAQATRSGGRMNEVIAGLNRSARGGAGGPFRPPAPPVPARIEGPPPVTTPRPDTPTPPPPATRPRDDDASSVRSDDSFHSTRTHQSDDTVPPPPLPPRDADAPIPPPGTPWTKAHETWLKDKMPDAYNTYKFNENWLKENHPDAFNSLKSWIADSDGIKEMWSWPVKAAQDAARQMLDIEKTARAGAAPVWTP